MGPRRGRSSTSAGRSGGGSSSSSSGNKSNNRRSASSSRINKPPPAAQEPSSTGHEDEVAIMDHPRREDHVVDTTEAEELPLRPPQNQEDHPPQPQEEEGGGGDEEKEEPQRPSKRPKRATTTTTSRRRSSTTSGRSSSSSSSTHKEPKNNHRIMKDQEPTDPIHHPNQPQDHDKEDDNNDDPTFRKSKTLLPQPPDVTTTTTTTTTTTSHPNPFLTNQNLVSETSISELYQQLQLYHFDDNDEMSNITKLIRQWEERGVLEQVIWPCLMMMMMMTNHSSSSSSNNNSNVDDDDQKTYHQHKDWYHGCQLLAFIMSEKYRQQHGSLSSPLELLPSFHSKNEEEVKEDINLSQRKQKRMVFQKVIITLLQQQDATNSTMMNHIHSKENSLSSSSWWSSTMVVHFVTILLNCRGHHRSNQQQQCPLNNPNDYDHDDDDDEDKWLLSWLEPHLFGISLWNWIPKRRLELELKRTTPFHRHKYYQHQSQDHSSSNQNISNNDNNNNIPWIVSMVQLVLQVIECTFSMVNYSNHQTIVNNIMDMNQPVNRIYPDDDDDIDDRKKLDHNHREVDPTATAKSPRLHPIMNQLYFICRVMELLVDVLSLADTRFYLVTYLESIHFMVRLEMALENMKKRKHSLDHGTHRRRGGLDDDDDDDNDLLVLSSSSTWLLLHDWIQRLKNLLAFPTTTLDDSTLHPQQRSSSQRDWVVATYHGRAGMVQKLCQRYYQNHQSMLAPIVYSGVGLLCRHGQKFVISTLKSIGTQYESVLRDLLHRLRLVDHYPNVTIPTTVTGSLPTSAEFLERVLLHYLTIPPDPLEQLLTWPLYPTETILWNEHLNPLSNGGGRGGVNGDDEDFNHKMMFRSVLPLPKLQTHFLSYADYLWRNFELVRLSSASDIREDLMDVLPRMRPVLRIQHDMMMYDDTNRTNHASKTDFRGWARMALEMITSEESGTSGTVRVQQVVPPKLGQTIPSQVVAEFTVDLIHCGSSIRTEWDSLAEYDNLFLVAIDANQITGASTTEDDDASKPNKHDLLLQMQRQFGVCRVRGCMILHVKDEAGNILNDPASTAANGPGPSGTKRTFRVLLDPAQYAQDARSPSGTQIYRTLNLVVRRRGRENNFKAVLETIRGLLKGSGSIHRVIPTWLQALLLGYGDPKSAHYRSNTIKLYAANTPGVTRPDAPLDFGDTFLSEEHLRSSFPSSGGQNCKIIVDGREELLHTLDTPAEQPARKNYKIRTIETTSGDGSTSTVIEATSYSSPAGLSGNPVRFTPVQVEAIRSGLSSGLTLVVGPPGTGKTDLAVAIIAGLYHSFPVQRTVIITHSNAALNDIFQKVMDRGDIDERHMIRLGAGERELQTKSSHDFTKGGRVAHSLARRAQLLEQVQQLSESLGLSGKAERGVDGSPSYTCETAHYFFRHHVQRRLVQFERQLKELVQTDTNDLVDVASVFPFAQYFRSSNTNSPLLSLKDARTMISTLDRLFQELAEYRPLEVLRSHRQRTDYLLMKQARIVAMTCTHAAIARSHLIELGFHYDNIVMEEAAQMMEVEAFVPLLLQSGGETQNYDDNEEENNEDEATSSSGALSRLKRVCLIGDHHQLPPVVKNRVLARASNLDQSLFTRLIRLGVPYTQLNQQGRARPELARLYSWCYPGLGNLGHVLQESKSFSFANPGMAHTYQLIEVEDFDGRGETCPTPYYYQNVGEAEYTVAMFQFMVLIGYPPHTISILTTYNGQKDLIVDIMSKRCGPDTPMASIRPKSISTVDQYQGQQNDYILLSLVRTMSVGHIRDLRRMIVAVSRARLGLYVLCRPSVFAQCHDLQPVWEPLAKKEPSAKLQIVLNEHYPKTTRRPQHYDDDDVALSGAAIVDGGDYDRHSTETKNTKDDENDDNDDSHDLLTVENVIQLGAIVYAMQQEWNPSTHHHDTLMEDNSYPNALNEANGGNQEE